MSASFKQLLEKYDYCLPEGLIAQEPASPRDSARLLVCRKDDDEVKFDTFRNIGKYLPKDAILVFNQTRVIPAKIAMAKPTGGKVELLHLGYEKGLIKALANKFLSAGTVISYLHPPLRRAGDREGAIQLEVVEKTGNGYLFKPCFSISKWPDILQKFGQTPLPPYIKHSRLNEKQKREQYQAIFAKTGESIAAPTASLHFTRRLIANLKKQGISMAFVNLNVNLGTFASLREEQVNSGRLHLETYHIDKKTARFLNKAKSQGRPIIAVGTTVVRTLESASSLCHSGQTSASRGTGQNLYQLTNLSDQTDLFIKEGYQFKFIDGMITNFHVPRSSLLMLVSTLIGRKRLFGLYQEAIKKNFRFFSFGDGMLILP